MALPQPPSPTTTTCFRHPGREAWRRCTRCGRAAVRRMPRPGAGRQPLRRVRQAVPTGRADPRPLLERPPADPRHLHPDRDQHRRVRLARVPGSRQHHRPAQHHRGPSRAGPGQERISQRTGHRAGAGRVVPAGDVGVPALRDHPHRVQHALAVPAGPAARTGDRADPVRPALLRRPARRLCGRASAAAQRVPRRRLRRGLRADGRGVRRPAPPRRQPDDDRARHHAAPQPVAHVHDPRASRSAATSAASSAARPPAGSSSPPTTSECRAGPPTPPRWPSWSSP